MRVLLVNPETKDKPLLPPLEVLYTAGYLKSKGVSVKVIDLSTEKEKEYTKLLSDYLPIIVGINCNKENYEQSLVLAGHARNESALTVATGSHPTSKPGLFTIFDSVIIGEPEKAFYNYVKNPRKGHVKSVYFDLNKMPFPAIDLIELKKYNYFSSISTSRGEGSLWRGRKPENIIKEVEWQLSLGVKELCFTDEQMNYNADRVIKVCNLMIKKGIKLEWQCPKGLIIEQINKSMLEKMKSAGCHSITIKPVSGNQSVLKRLRKNYTTEQVKAVRDWCRELGIKLTAHFKTGFQFETKGSINRTMNFIKELKPDKLVLKKIIN